ncbi:unnamed protein product, partial [Owenia fusiformis]
LNNFAIYIGNEECMTYKGEINTPHEITCDEAKHGRSIMIKMMDDTPSQLALCYVEVHAKVHCTEQLISGNIYHVDDARLSASSTWDERHGVQRSRLNTPGNSTLVGAWSARINDLNQWIQVDLGEVMLVSGVITQGRPDYIQWV